MHLTPNTDVGNTCMHVGRTEGVRRRTCDGGRLDGGENEASLCGGWNRGVGGGDD